MARQQDESVILYSGVSAPTIEVQEGGSATYKSGDLVEFDSSGQIIIGTCQNFLGIATEDATGSAGSASDTQDMELIMLDALYLITQASAVATAQAHVGHKYELDFTAGAHYVTATATNPDVIVMGIYPGDLAVAGGRYIVRFNPAAIVGV